MSQSVLDEPIEKPNRQPEHDRLQAWTMLTLALAIVLLGNNLRVLFDPFPSILLDQFGILITTTQFIYWLVFSTGALLWTQHQVSIQPGVRPWKVIVLSAISAFFALLTVKSVAIFAAFSIAGVWVPFLQEGFFMGIYSASLSAAYGAIRFRWNSLPALGLCFVFGILAYLQFR